MIVRRHMCGGIKVGEIHVTPKTASINKGATVQLSAEVLPPDATDPTVLWSSAQTNIATVNNAGLVTGVGKGSATITASSVGGDVRDTSVVSVVVPVSRVTLNTGQVTQNKGTTYRLTATVAPADASDTRVLWSSANTNTATVDQSGLVTFRAAGSTVVTAQSVADSTKKATCSVTTNVPVQGISLNYSSIERMVGEAFQLNATITPSDATNKNITWSSGSPNIVSVNSYGYVQCRAVGSGYIYAQTQEGQKVASCYVNVKPATIPVTGVSLNQTYVRPVGTGSRHTLTATVTPSNATDRTLSWSVNYPAYAEVTPVKVPPLNRANVYVINLPRGGNFTVTVTCGGKTASCTFSNL